MTGAEARTLACCHVSSLALQRASVPGTDGTMPGTYNTKEVFHEEEITQDVDY